VKRVSTRPETLRTFANRVYVNEKISNCTWQVDHLVGCSIKDFNRPFENPKLSKSNNGSLDNQFDPLHAAFVTVQLPGNGIQEQSGHLKRYYRNIANDGEAASYVHRGVKRNSCISISLVNFPFHVDKDVQVKDQLIFHFSTMKRSQSFCFHPQNRDAVVSSVQLYTSLLRLIRTTMLREALRDFLRRLHRHC
jgi:hypothetical protein